MSEDRPPSSAPRSARYSAASSGARPFSSDSTCADTMTTSRPSSAAFLRSACTCTLPAPASARSPSATLAAYVTGFMVSRNRPFTAFISSAVRSAALAGLLASSAAVILVKASASTLAASSSSFPFPFTFLCCRFSICRRSAIANSRLIVSVSSMGSTFPATCTTFSSSKHRTTCTMESHSRMLARNLLPRPSPWEAPFTSPAMSTNSTVVGTTFSLSPISCSVSSRLSGTTTVPWLGSMVQKG
mmetsp:Transcript_10976/g.32900  ORF Transcript_10976/g.32900 Transcript_10976/m.32900 type:complete len:244 (-) Transcript_10976:474-1205(-)